MRRTFILAVFSGLTFGFLALTSSCTTSGVVLSLDGDLEFITEAPMEEETAEACPEGYRRDEASGECRLIPSDEETEWMEFPEEEPSDSATESDAPTEIDPEIDLETVDHSEGCTTSEECPDSQICGAGGVCAPPCSETGCEEGACNPNNGRCEFCEASCPSGQCCVTDGYFWTCGACCAPPCPEGSACQVDGACEPLCSMTCPEGYICGPQTKYLCTKSIPSECFNLPYDPTLTASVPERLALPMATIRDSLVVRGKNGGKQVAAIRGDLLKVYSPTPGGGYQSETVADLIWQGDLMAFLADESGALHIVAETNTNERSYIYATNRGGTWVVEPFPVVDLRSGQLWPHDFNRNLAIDSEGAYHFAWCDDSRVLHYGTNRSGVFASRMIDEVPCNVLAALSVTTAGSPEIIAVSDYGTATFVRFVGSEPASEPLPMPEVPARVYIRSIDAVVAHDSTDRLHLVFLTDEDYGAIHADYFIRTEEGWTRERFDVGDGLSDDLILIIEENGDVKLAGLSERPAGALCQIFTRSSGGWTSISHSRSTEEGSAESLALEPGGDLLLTLNLLDGPLSLLEVGETTRSTFLDANDNPRNSNWAVGPDGRPSFLISSSEWDEGALSKSLLLMTLASGGGFESRVIATATGDYSFSPMILRSDSSGFLHGIFHGSNETGNLYFYSTNRSGAWVTTDAPLPLEVRNGTVWLRDIDMDVDENGRPHFLFTLISKDYSETYRLYGLYDQSALTTQALSSIEPMDEARLRLDGEDRPVIAFIRENSFYTASPEETGWTAHRIAIGSHHFLEDLQMETGPDGSLFVRFDIMQTMCARPGCSSSAVVGAFMVRRNGIWTCSHYSHGPDLAALTVDGEGHAHFMSEYNNMYCTDRFGELRCTDDVFLPDDSAVPGGWRHANQLAVTSDGRVHMLYSYDTRYASFLPALKD